MDQINEQEIGNQWQNRFYECLAMEFSNPAYFKVHHLLVVTYMLQSDGYSANTFAKAADLLEGFLLDNEDPLRLVKHLFDTGRKDKILNQGKREIMKFPWVKTILDVRTENSNVYRSDVTSWANSVLSVIRNDR